MKPDPKRVATRHKKSSTPHWDGTPKLRHWYKVVRPFSLAHGKKGLHRLRRGDYIQYVGSVYDSRSRSHVDGFMTLDKKVTGWPVPNNWGSILPGFVVPWEGNKQ